MRIARISLVGVIAASFCLSAAPAQASWQLYVDGKLGYSIAKVKATGFANIATPPEAFSGSDQNVSPLLGGAFGVEIPLPELTPWRLPYDLRWPDWSIRSEFEAVGLREYRVSTDGLFAGGGNSNSIYTKTKMWSLTQNVWLDLPLNGLHRPISAVSNLLFRQPRLPRLRRILKSTTAHVGLGIGLGHQQIRVDESNFDGKTKKYDFAYLFGTGLGYQLTDNVNFGLGYRFHKTTKLKVDLRDDANRSGRATVSSDVHELQFVVRVRIFDLPYPWR